MGLIVAGALTVGGLSVGSHQATQRRRLIWLTLNALVWSLALSQMILVYSVGAVAVVLTTIVGGLVVWRPRLGLYLAYALVLIFEAESRDPLMLPGQYLNKGFQSSFGLPGFIASPLELMLVLAFVSWFASAVVSRPRDLRGGILFVPCALFFLALLAGIVRGRVAGGDLYIAFWEARALLNVFVCYLLAVNTIRSRRHISELTAISLIGTAAFAIEGAYRKLALIDTGALGAAQEFHWEHSDVIFLSTLLLLIFAQQVTGAPKWQRAVGLFLAPIALFTLLATERRAGYIGLGAAFVAMCLVLLFTNRKLFFLVAAPLLIASLIYLPLFWNASGLLGQPARAVRSISNPDERDAGSNAYRAMERVNVVETIRANRLLGVGFGQPFAFVIALPDLSWWPFWRYEPHHNVLWVWLKTGAVGFGLFWMLIGTAIAVAANLARRASDPGVRPFALTAVGAIIVVLVFSYVDLGLTSGRVTIFLGTILGAIAAADRVSTERPAPATSATCPGLGTRDGASLGHWPVLDRSEIRRHELPDIV
jgi:hypothetical protein